MPKLIILTLFLLSFTTIAEAKITPEQAQELITHLRSEEVTEIRRGLHKVTALQPKLKTIDLALVKLLRESDLSLKPYVAQTLMALDNPKGIEFFKELLLDESIPLDLRVYWTGQLTKHSSTESLALLKQLSQSDIERLKIQATLTLIESGIILDVETLKSTYNIADPARKPDVLRAAAKNSREYFDLLEIGYLERSQAISQIALDLLIELDSKQAQKLIGFSIQQLQHESTRMNAELYLAHSTGREPIFVIEQYRSENTYKRSRALNALRRNKTIAMNGVLKATEKLIELETDPFEREKLEALTTNKQVE